MRMLSEYGGDLECGWGYRGHWFGYGRGGLYLWTLSRSELEIYLLG